MKTIRELREARAKLIADAQLLLKSETRSAEDFAKATKMLDDADGVKTQYEALERADAAEAESRSIKPLNNPAPGAIDSPEARAAAAKEAFRNYIVTGRVSAESSRHLRSFNRSTMQMVSGEHRDMGTGTTGGDTGGFIIPTGFNADIEQALQAYGPMVSTVRNWNTENGAPIAWPLSNDLANFSVEMTDGIDVGESDIPLSQVTFNTSTFSTGVIKVSRSLVTDAAFDVGSFINENFGVRMARGLNKAVTNGSTSGNVASIVAGATVGATTAAPTAITYLDLVNLYSSLDPAYTGNATWAFNNTVLRGLIGMEDLYGRPLFVASITSGIPDSVLGRPFILNMDLASPAATTKSVLFGDLSKYVLRNVGGLEVLKLSERYAPAHQYGYVGFHRHAGKLLDAGGHPVKLLQQHA